MGGTASPASGTAKVTTNVSWSVYALAAGTITFKLDGVTKGSITLSSSQSGSYTFTGVTPGLHKFLAVHSVNGSTAKQNYLVDQWYLVETEYDNLGNVTKQVINNQYTELYTYDVQGRLSEVKAGTTAANATVQATYTYNKADQVLGTNYNPISKNVANTYDIRRGWLTKVENTGNFTETLGYFKNGNVKTQAVINNQFSSSTATSTYAYDAYNRLTEVTGANVETFGYDNDGNLSQKIGNSKYYQYTYLAGTNKLTTLYNIGGTPNSFAYTYDAKGNMRTDTRNKVTSITYDHRNLPLTMVKNGTTSKYGYDDQGNRITKETGSLKEFYLRDHTGKELAIFTPGTNTIKMVNLYGNGIIGRVEGSTFATKYYYVKDHLGSIRVTLNGSGGRVSAQDYYAFGGYARSWNSGEANGKYKFTEKERDAETGYDYFGARFYDSEIGRWQSVDPLAVKYPGWSPYNYCKNNPLILIDPTGMGDENADEEEKERDRLFYWLYSGHTGFPPASYNPGNNSSASHSVYASMEYNPGLGIEVFTETTTSTSNGVTTNATISATINRKGHVMYNTITSVNGEKTSNINSGSLSNFSPYMQEKITKTLGLRAMGKDCLTVQIAKEYNVARRETMRRENYFNAITTPIFFYLGGGFKQLFTMPQNMMQAANQCLGVGGIIQSGLSWNFNSDKDEVNTNSYIYQRIK